MRRRKASRSKKAVEVGAVVRVQVPDRKGRGIRDQSGGPGTVDANVFRRSVDYAEEFAVGLHLVLDDGTVGYCEAGSGEGVRLTLIIE